jgi:hypothetical protein
MLSPVIFINIIVSANGLLKGSAGTEIVNVQDSLYSNMMNANSSNTITGFIVGFYGNFSSNLDLSLKLVMINSTNYNAIFTTSYSNRFVNCTYYRVSVQNTITDSAQTGLIYGYMETQQTQIYPTIPSVNDVYFFGLVAFSQNSSVL